MMEDMLRSALSKVALKTDVVLIVCVRLKLKELGLTFFCVCVCVSVCVLYMYKLMQCVCQCYMSGSKLVRSVSIYLNLRFYKCEYLFIPQVLQASACFNLSLIYYIKSLHINFSLYIMHSCVVSFSSNSSMILWEWLI